jgi:hypothetical protein
LVTAAYHDGSAHQGPRLRRGAFSRASCRCQLPCHGVDLLRRFEALDRRHRQLRGAVRRTPERTGYRADGVGVAAGLGCECERSFKRLLLTESAAA